MFIKLLKFLIMPWRFKSGNTKKYVAFRAGLYLGFCVLSFSVLIILFMIIGKIFFPIPMYRLKPMPSVIVFDRNGKILRGFTAPDQMWRIPADIDDVSPNLKMAVINYEDKWFRYHFGVNPISILRALITNIKAGEIVCGGSTITMQVARMMEPKPRTIKSKLIEMIRAFQLELSFSKDEILSFYFNLAPYGGNIVGSASASYFYFNKDQKNLSLGESALLAVIPNSPTILRPDRTINNKPNTHLLIKARDKVLRRLLENHKISQQEYDEAINEPIPTERFSLPFHAPQLALKLKDMYPGVNKIMSTIDINIQMLARDTLRRRLDPLKSHGITNGAVVVMDTETHEVLAMVSSVDFFDNSSEGQVNGAMSPRSPGSALKPFVYALAIDRGIISPQSILSDVPVDYSGYKPENYDEKYRGFISAKEALRHSLNIPAINLSAKLGEDGLYEFLKNAGITTLTEPKEHYGLSLVLGGCEVTLLELTNLYAVLADMGRFSPYKLTIGETKRDNKLRLFVRSDEVVPPHLDKNISRRLLREGTAYILTEMLTEVDRPDLPTCWESAVNLPKVAWKTGTSYGHKDAWSIGYTPQFTIGVWVGNFNGVGVPALVGSESAAPILFDLFNALSARSNKQWYVQPSDVKEREVCSLSGMCMSPNCPHSKTELYIPGVSPYQECNMHRAIAIDKETGLRLCSNCRIGRDYEMKTFVIWPPEIATWLEQNGVVVDKLPPHFPECPVVASGEGPVIRSPSDNSEYIIREGVDLEYQKILLSASISNDSRSLYWFLNSKMIFNGSPAEKVFITPTVGKHVVMCMDDEGRAAKVTFIVR
ncbi:TPA: penicillin-binding protein 1C [Candidatus Poribacteria bacterium]|nr:penicillin-binding protein 1C [Candidatus Poribacteria bacterium]